MFGSGFSWPMTSPVASAVASSETSTGVATAPIPVSIDDHSLIGTPRYFLPCMSFGDSTFSFEVRWRAPWCELPMMRMPPLSTSCLLMSWSGADVRGSVATMACSASRDTKGVLNTATIGRILPSEAKSWWPMAIEPALIPSTISPTPPLGVREHLDLDPAVGALLDRLRDLVGIERLRCVCDADMGVAQPDLGRGVARRAGDADDDRSRNKGRKTSHRGRPVDARFAPCRPRPLAPTLATCIAIMEGQRAGWRGDLEGAGHGALCVAATNGAECPP